MLRAIALVLFSTALIAPAQAATQESEIFGQCLIGKTTGDDRLLLVRWITFAFASHPVVQDAITVETALLAETDKKIADLVMALLTERCSAEAKAAVIAEGNPAIAIQKAFEMLGMVASQEVMMDPAAQQRINAFGGLLDEARLSAALTP